MVVPLVPAGRIPTPAGRFVVDAVSKARSTPAGAHTGAVEIARLKVCCDRIGAFAQAALNGRERGTGVSHRVNCVHVNVSTNCLLPESQAKKTQPDEQRS